MTDRGKQNNHYSFYFLVWLPTVAYCGMIYYLSGNPSPIEVDQFPHQDKVLHLLEYGILSVLFFYSLSKSIPSYSVRAVVVLAIVLTSLYGISDEAHQYFVPGRDSSIGDVFADFIGATLFQSKNIWNYSAIKAQRH